MAVVRAHSKDFNLDSNAIKAILLQHFRFGMQTIVCTEYDYCDIFAMEPKKKIITEVEIKVSLSDLAADFKKPHRVDLQHTENGVFIRPRAFKNGRPMNVLPIYPPIIDKLYYAMPSAIVEKGQELLGKNMPFAGVIEIPEPRAHRYTNGDRVHVEPRVVKRARRLSSTDPERDWDKVYQQVCMRMSSDLATRYTAMYLGGSHAQS
jgi:hypothetical protein